MKIVKQTDGYWITAIPHDCGDCGPYETQADARETRDGLQRTFDNLDNWSFFTTERKPVDKKPVSGVLPV